MAKTKKCKHCNTEVDAKAKICPSCGKKLGLSLAKKIIIGVIILIIIFILLPTGSVDNDQEPQETTEVITETETTTEDTTEVTTVTETTTAEPTTEAVTEAATEAETEAPHRDGMYGISDKDYSEIDDSPYIGDARNDTTGNWRYTTIYNNAPIEEYALSYYNTCFKDDAEIHDIVNLYLNTATKIACYGDYLSVTVYEYTDGEEHDANLMFNGMVLADYIIYLDNGDIEKL